MKKWLRENKGFLLFILLLGIFRTAVADWNPIPSGSMRPNLLEGDVVFVNRLAYDLKLPLTDVVLAHLNDPRRGDIVTFTSPADGKRLIKRLIALPGDRVEMRNKQLLINGEPAEYDLLSLTTETLSQGQDLPAVRLSEKVAGKQRVIQWLPDLHRATDFAPMVVPEDRFMMLGDNRDNSVDSRYIGLVPRNVLIGRAERILVSAAILDDWSLRTERIGLSLY
ncbi:MAG: signal peptidase I [Sideroxydans sp.]|nr:signal peptidase I [Sideroxydans sp.]